MLIHMASTFKVRGNEQDRDCPKPKKDCNEPMGDVIVRIYKIHNIFRQILNIEMRHT